jgi:queuine/archaeosine tRNA-ribosyltransferase
VRTYDAEDVFQLLNFHNLNLTLNHLAEIRKQSTLEETE